MKDEQNNLYPGDTVEGITVDASLKLYECGHCHKGFSITNGPDGLLFCPFCGVLNSF